MTRRAHAEVPMSDSAGVVQVEDLDRVHLQLVCIETDNLSTERLTQLQVESVKQRHGKTANGPY
jgi:hypothetical protein